MGVKPCSRKYCENIMCDTYINRVGYICDECKEEFRKSINDKPIQSYRRDYLNMRLECFIKEPKNKEEMITTKTFFNE